MRMEVQPKTVHVSIVGTAEGQNAKYVVFNADMNGNTYTYVVRYTDNLYAAIKAKVIAEYYKSDVGGVEVEGVL